MRIKTRRRHGVLGAIALMSALALAPNSVLAGGGPSNDAFANRTTIHSLPYSSTQSIGTATSEAGEPTSVCHESTAHTIWYAYTPSTTQYVQADTLKSNFPGGAISVFKGTSLATLHPVDCNDGQSQNGESRAVITWRAVKGTHYAIRVAANASAGLARLSVRKVNAPAHDAYASALKIGSLPFSYSATTATATRESGEPTALGDAIGATLWFSFKPSASQYLELDTFDSDYDTIIAVYKGSSLSGLVRVATDDDSHGGLFDYQSNITFRAIAGNTYHFQVGGYDSGSGTLALRVRKVTPPSNDSFSSAKVIGSVPAYYSGNTRKATLQSGEPVPSCAGDQTGATVWFERTVSTTGTLHIDPSGTQFRGIVGAWTGNTLGTLMEIGCTTVVENGSTTPIDASVTAGQHVYISLGGANEPDSGAYSLVVSEGP